MSQLPGHRKESLANLDCVHVENALVYVVPKIEENLAHPDFVVLLLLQLMVATTLATYIAKQCVNKHTCLFGLYSSCECFGFLSSSSTMAFDLALMAMWSAESPLLSVALSLALLSSSNSTASTQRPRTALKNARFGH